MKWWKQLKADWAEEARICKKTPFNIDFVIRRKGNAFLQFVTNSNQKVVRCICGPKEHENLISCAAHGAETIFHEYLIAGKNFIKNNTIHEMKRVDENDPEGPQSFTEAEFKHFHDLLLK